MDQEKKSEIVVSVQPSHSRMTSDDSIKMKKFHDNEEDEMSSQSSNAISLEEAEAGTAKPNLYRRSRSGSIKRWLNFSDSAKQTRRQKWCRWTLIVLVVLGFFGIIAAM
jgi:hypothetical protein